MIGGQQLKVGWRYLDTFSAHVAWLDDHRGESNGRRADRLIGGALASPVSRSWKGILATARNGTASSTGHAHALFDHPDKLAAPGVTQGLDGFEAP